MNENEYIVNSFTKKGDNINLEVDNLNVSCITSKSNNFEVDSEGNLTAKTITTTKRITPNQDIIDLIYPVGSIYMSVNNINPTTLFGGNWDQLKDRFLLGSGDIYTNGTIGGERLHTLTIDEMPGHNHEVARCGGGSIVGDNSERKIAASYTDSSWWPMSTTTYTGHGIAHNNMPPYLVVNIWKRIS